MRAERASPFLTLWSLAVLAVTAAFVLYLGLRVRSVELGYELGRSHARVARLREVKRVLELELASHKTPERVELVARNLLGMSEPGPDRILPAGLEPVDEQAQGASPAPDPAGSAASPAALPPPAPAVRSDEPPAAGARPVELPPDLEDEAP